MSRVSSLKKKTLVKQLQKAKIVIVGTRAFTQTAWIEILRRVKETVESTGGSDQSIVEVYKATYPECRSWAVNEIRGVIPKAKKQSTRSCHPTKPARAPVPKGPVSEVKEETEDDEEDFEDDDDDDDEEEEERDAEQSSKGLNQSVKCDLPGVHALVAANGTAGMGIKELAVTLHVARKGLKKRLRERNLAAGGGRVFTKYAWAVKID